MLFIGSCAAKFYALDKETGKVIWNYDISQDGDQSSFHGDMLITDKYVVIGTDTNVGYIYAFEKETGKVSWKYPLSKGAPTDILRKVSKIYTVTENDEVICLDLNSGRLLWDFKSRSKRNPFLISNQSAALAKDQIFFGGQDGNVYALDADFGKQNWMTEMGARVSTSLIAHNQAVYLGAADGKLYRVSQKSGKIVSEHSTESIPVGRLSLNETGLYVFLDPRGRGYGSKLLLAVDLSLQKRLWQHKPDFTWSGTKSHILNQTLLTGTKGKLIAHDLNDGTQKWSANFAGHVRSIGSHKDTLYVGAREGVVYAIKSSSAQNSLSSN